MSDHKQQLEAAMRAFNEAERAEFTLTTSTRWLGNSGPTYLLGDVRVAALFEDARGRHWVDAFLAVESLTGIAELARRNGGLMEGYRWAAAQMDDAHDLWVCTETRGKWNAVLAPIGSLAHTWGYPPPVRMPNGNWARTWMDMPERTDQQELGWIAHGGKPTRSYRVGGQL
ncbi:hypothetical protein LRD69_13890 [Streptomyces sp. JH14]|uniref:hypothetical protein n=1 Tax=Streptomyces sp. JH14 TaxID=2793630 RepID=UPI0023F74782|nr:hypothetical protein [Streptomyces sp. JH14]MDF6043219.1 hypothetical protein [Streptomyces sp. JH14]